MSDFALTFLYVVPTTNSIPTTGSTDVLTAGQTGVFLSDYSAGTAGTVPDEPYIFIAQGRADKSLPSLRSDKIAASQVVKYTKAEGSDVAVNEIWEVGDFKVGVGETLTLTINAHSFYLDTAYYNGLTRSVVVTPECFDCGDDPCTDVDNEVVIDAILAKLNQDFNGSKRTAGNLTQYFDFEKIGTGDDAVLRITAKAITKYGQPCDPAAFPHMFDRVWFRPFAFVGPDTTSDFQVNDNCDLAATATLIQRSQYASLTSDEVAQMEKDYYSYKVDRFKNIFTKVGYNALFESYVEDGIVYDQLLVDFYPADRTINAWNPSEVKQLSRVLLYVESGDTDLEDILTAYFGYGPTVLTGTAPSTTTTTSTSTTTTTSTTTLIP